MPKDLLLIICISAGRQDEVSAACKQLFADYKVSATIRTIRIPPELPKLLRKLNLNKFAAVAVYGGDGTIVAAIKAFQTTKTPLILMPGGTANEVTRYIGMPSDPLACLRMYLEHTYVQDHLDIAQIEDEPLVLDMHMGLWTDAITNTPRHLKKRIGSAAYAWSTLREVGKTTKQDYTFAIDGKPAIKVPGYTFLVANQGRHKILGLPLFPYDHAPGMVQLAIVKRVRPYMLVAWFFYKLITGQNLQSVIGVYRAHSIRVLDAPNVAIADDSEQHMRPPFVVEGSMQSVRVLVPPAATSQRFYKVWWQRARLWSLRTRQRLTVFTGQQPELRFSHVAPGIYLGGKVTPRVFKTFSEWGVTGVVSMRTTRPPKTPEHIETLWLPTKDWTPPALKDFAKGVKFIQKQLAKNGAVYIHCQLGEGRGPSMAAAYLITTGFTAEEAVSRLVKYRPMVHPNPQQMKRLAEWQEVYNKYLAA